MDGYTRRNTLRYPGYDYAQPGATLVTLCTHNRQRLFGHVQDGAMMLTPAGQMVAERWAALEAGYPDVLLDAFIVMPDHLHGIVLTGAHPDHEVARTSVSDIVRSFKNSVLHAWRDGVERYGWPRYEGHLWQRHFHDRIVRRDEPLDHVRAYIAGNPGRWEERRRG